MLIALNKKFVFKLSLSFLLLLGLFGCSDKVIKTPEGIPRRVVISNKDGTTIYESSKLTQPKDKAKQWDVFFCLKMMMITTKFQPA